jgi:hypothetical protein
VEASELELYKDTMEEEIEEFYVSQEELVTIEHHGCRQGKFRSSDGHTFHVESDVTKQYVTFMFEEEGEEPVTNDMTRRAKKAAKRARQRSVVEEELEELYTPQEEPETSEHLEAVMSAMECTYREHRQGMKPSKFQSTTSSTWRGTSPSNRSPSCSGRRSQSPMRWPGATRRQPRELGKGQPSTVQLPWWRWKIGGWSALTMDAQQGRGEQNSRPQPLHQHKHLLTWGFTGKLPMASMELMPG